MKISFRRLNQSHFCLLTKWLEEPHVKAWWDTDITYTEDSVNKKYSSYAKGYKIENNQKKKIDAFIIYANEQPIGYIQAYNIQDFPIAKLANESLLGFDIFIGEKNYLGKSIGSKSLKLFFDEFYQHSCESIFVETDSKNIAAIKAYEKAGFIKNKEFSSDRKVWMFKAKSRYSSCNNNREYI